MPYEPEFARVYDILVNAAEESFAAEHEIEVLEWAFGQAGRPVEEVLDAGCGQGRHLIPLATAGYRLTGLDLSAEMLAVCRRRLEERGLDAALTEGDVAALDADQAYDAIVCLDSVICYLLDPERITDTLVAFRRALRPGGLLVLEFYNILGEWYLFGPTRPFTYEGNTLRVEWEETYTYEGFPSILRMAFSGEYVEDGIARTFAREEVLRAMTAGEMTMYLRAAGYERIAVFPDYDRTNLRAKDAEALVFVAFNPESAPGH